MSRILTTYHFESFVQLQMMVPLKGVYKWIAVASKQAAEMINLLMQHISE